MSLLCTTPAGAGQGEGVHWTSQGEDSFTIESGDDIAPELARGTRVVLHLEEDAKEFADDYRVRSVVRKYSDHIGVPVRMVKQGVEIASTGGEPGQAA